MDADSAIRLAHQGTTKGAIRVRHQYECGGAGCDLLFLQRSIDERHDVTMSMLQICHSGQFLLDLGNALASIRLGNMQHNRIAALQ
jgi:hypothetical protein